MTEFIYQQTLIQWRIPVLPSGKLGTPELVKKFTTEIGDNRKKYIKPKKEIKAAKKAVTKKNVNNLFKMSVGNEESI